MSEEQRGEEIRKDLMLTDKMYILGIVPYTFKYAASMRAWTEPDMPCFVEFSAKSAMNVLVQHTIKFTQQGPDTLATDSVKVSQLGVAAVSGTSSRTASSATMASLCCFMLK